MKGKKIMATVIAMAMVLSALVVVNNLTDVKMNASATYVEPGISSWHGTDESTSSSHSFLNLSSTDDLYYGNNDVDLTFNGSVVDRACGLYKPTYNRVWDGLPGADYEFWLNYTYVCAVSDWNEAEPYINDVDFDRAGLWLVVPSTAPNFGNLDTYNMSNLSIKEAGAWEDIIGWFWVNSSEWTVELSDDTIYYDANNSLTITVKDSSGDVVTGVDGWIDIWNVSGYDHSLVYHNEINLATGEEFVWEIDNMYSYTHNRGAGTYRVTAYASYLGTSNNFDYAEEIYGEKGNDVGVGYNSSFGNVSITGSRFNHGNTITMIRDVGGSNVVSTTWANTTYKWDTCGPFDPPEYWADYVNFTVAAGVPTFTVENGTQFWKDTQDNMVTIKIYNGDVNITSLFDNASDVTLYNNTNKPTKSNSVPIPNFNNYVYINSTDDLMTIQPKAGYTWGSNSTASWVWAPRGTLYVVFANSTVGNATEEWNGTATIELVKATNKLKWVDDGSTDVTDGGTDDTDGVLGAIPKIAEVPVVVEFKVISPDYYYWGDTQGGETVLEAAENITISGDSLFTGTLDTLPGYTNAWFGQDAPNTWSVPIIPTMSIGGGEITITATAWNTTITGTLSIGGTSYWQHGSVVSVDPNSFMIDQEDQELTITIKDAKGNVNPYATVWLLYTNDTGIPYYKHNLTSNGGFVADENGAYTWNFNITQQTTNQTNVDFDGDGSIVDSEIKAPRNLTVYVDASNAGRGYALIQMTKVNDLEVELSRTTMLAGMSYDDFTLDCTVGNGTDTPSTDTADRDKFHMEIYDEDGNDVTDTLLHGITSTELTGPDAYLFDDGGDGFDGVYATEPGTYTVYAYNSTHDSTGHNATLVVEQVQVGCNIAGSGLNTFIWSSDENVSATFTVTYNGEPVNGTLRIDNMSSVSHTDGDYNVTWKNCSFGPDSITGLYDDADGTNNSIEIAEGDLVNGVATVSDITANYLNAGEAEQYISFYFRPTNANDEEGKWAKTTGQAIVTVPTVTFDGEDSSGQKYIAKGDSDIEATITGRGSPLSNIFLRLHGQGIDQNGTSDADGEVSFSVTSTSTGNISIDVGEEGRTIDKVIIVTNWKLDISAPIEVNEGTEFTVTVIKKGTTTAVEGATVTIDGIGTGTTDSSGQAKFTKATVTSDRAFTIEATKTGYADATKKITIINVPSLSIALSRDTNENGEYTSPVTVTVYDDDDGSLITGATVTFGDQTGTTINGQATFSVTEKTVVTITATFGTYVAAEDATITALPAGGIPGFELLTLVAALGVCLILFRRRKQ